MKVGSFLGCHQLGSRSFFVKGYQLPVCARCTGIYIGFFIGFLFEVPSSYLYALFLALTPLILDGTLQLLTSYRSNNPKRLVTGLLFGLALQGILFDIFIL